MGITRRGFLKAGAITALAPGIMTGCETTRRGGAKPNLVFLWTDEQTRATMSAYGNHAIDTPNLNKLASESVVFERAYCTQPVCTPSRSSIMTGLWPHQTQCLQNNHILPTEAQCFPELLDDPDYRTAYMGKWHLGDEVFAQHGFEEWVSMEDGYIKYFSEGRDLDARSSYHQFLKDLDYTPDIANGLYSRNFAVRLPLEHCKPEFLANEACDFLRRSKDSPFILHVNYLEPHMPFFGPLNEHHDAASMPLAESLRHDLGEDDPLRNRVFREWYAQNGWDGVDLKTDAEWRQMTARYWGLVSQVDLSVGRILSMLQELNLDEETIVVFTSDHGEMMGAHGLFTKTFNYEESSGVPLLIRMPGADRRQIVIDEPVSQIDLTPTLLELMGKDLSEFALPGQSLLPLIAGDRVAEDHVFVQWNSYPQDLLARCRPEIKASFEAWLNEVAPAEAVTAAMASQWRMVVSPDGWKLCLMEGDKSQLFNLNKDPHELRNLIAEPEHQEVLNRLREKIHTWQASVGDTLAV